MSALHPGQSAACVNVSHPYNRNQENKSDKYGKAGQSEMDQIAKKTSLEKKI